MKVTKTRLVFESTYSKASRFRLETNNSKRGIILILIYNLYSNMIYIMNGYALGRKDSNLRIAGPKPDALPLGHAPLIFLFYTTKH